MKIPAIVVSAVAVIAMFSAPDTEARAQWQKSDIKALIVDEARRQNFPAGLALAVARVESNFDPAAVSSAGARGVMQIMPATAEQVLGISRHRLYNPRVNVRAGIQFLNDLIDTYNGRWDIALSHYNGGSAVRDKRGQLRVIPATRGYVNRVMQHSRTYARTLDYRPTRNNPVLLAAVSLDDFSPGGTFDTRFEYQPKQNFADQKRARIVSELQKLVTRNHQRSGSSAGNVEVSLHGW